MNKKPTSFARAIAVAAFFILLANVVACQKEDTYRTDGESHFLQTCASACGGGLQCICGVCTLPCESNGVCGMLAKGATCGAPTSGFSCSAAVASANVCQLSCTSSASCALLGAGFSCESGACAKQQPGKADGGSNEDASSVSPDSGPVALLPLPASKVDVLFMIDNSGSMKEEQEALGAAMPRFVTGLQNRFGPELDLHAGFITSDLGAGNVPLSGNPACNRPGGDRGELQARSGCGLASATARFLAFGKQGGEKNFSGDLSEVVGCMAQLGTQGCGFEHQLQAVRLALHPTATPSNAGFVRQDARLILVFLTDEDDCSGAANSDLYASQAYPGTAGSLRCSIQGHLCNGSKPPMSEFSTLMAGCVANPTPQGLLALSELVEAVRATKPQGWIEVTVLGGLPAGGAAWPPYAFSSSDLGQGSVLDGTPACSSTSGSAAPPLRLRAFAEAFGGDLMSICEPSYGAMMESVGSGL